MGVRFPSVVSNAQITNTLVTTAETLLCTSPPFTPPLDSAVIRIDFVVCLNTVSANSTFAILRIRRGTTLTGTQVNIGGGAQLTPGVQAYVDGWYFDVPGAVTGQQYSITVQIQGATANSTISDVALMVFAL